jgi:hypothetical protein
LEGIFRVNGHKPDPIAELLVNADTEEALLEQKSTLYLGERQEAESLAFYIREENDLLYNAAFNGGEGPSRRLPALASVAKKEGYDVKELCSILGSVVKDAPDAILRNETAVAILTIVAFYGGITFRSLNNFSEAYSSVAYLLRKKLKCRVYNNEINKVFRELLGAGYIAQGTTEEHQPAILATAKLDPYLRQNNHATSQ